MIEAHNAQGRLVGAAIPAASGGFTVVIKSTTPRLHDEQRWVPTEQEARELLVQHGAIEMTHKELA